jgi:hypothetical protein
LVSPAFAGLAAEGAAGAGVAEAAEGARTLTLAEAPAFMPRAEAAMGDSAMKTAGLSTVAVMTTVTFLPFSRFCTSTLELTGKELQAPKRPSVGKVTPSEMMALPSQVDAPKAKTDKARRAATSTFLFMIFPPYTMA